MQTILTKSNNRANHILLIEIYLIHIVYSTVTTKADLNITLLLTRSQLDNSI